MGPKLWCKHHYQHLVDNYTSKFLSLKLETPQSYLQVRTDKFSSYKVNQQIAIIENTVSRFGF